MPRLTMPVDMIADRQDARHQEVYWLARPSGDEC